MVQLLQTMNIEVELPITVYVDNLGAIWLSNNRTTCDGTKHRDIRTSFVKEYQEDGKIIIKFVKSEDNEADIFTKNTTNVIFQRHQKKLFWDKEEVNKEESQEESQELTQDEKSTGRMLKSKPDQDRLLVLDLDVKCVDSHLPKPLSHRKA